jgi:nicotinamidase/pyrazinamidase
MAPSWSDGAQRQGCTHDGPMSFALSAHDILLVVDVQNDFLPGGALAVPGGDALVPLINAIAPRFAHVALSQDWHVAGHSSFASSHPGRAPFDMIALPYGPQVLWPDHCVQGTDGARFAPALSVPHAEFVVRKGYRRDVDSYSVFCEADRVTRTGLAGYLRERGFTRVFFAGLATDFCVAWSAVDARAAGFDAVVIDDACRAIDTGGSLAAAWTNMREAGVAQVSMSDLPG